MAKDRDALLRNLIAAMATIVVAAALLFVARR